MVEAVIVFGSGVAGLSVHAYTHTPPMVEFTMEKETTAITPIDTTLSTTVLKHSRTSDYYASSPLSVHLHTQDFPGFTHTVFLYGFYGWSGCIISSQTDPWVAMVSLTLHCAFWGSSLHFVDGSLFIFTHRNLLCLISRS